MPYVARNTEGQIVAVAAEADDKIREAIAADAPELAGFILQLGSAIGGLARSDLALIRVVEDLVDTLIDKNLIRYTDLPEAAQQKLMLRRSLRRSQHSLNLLGDVGGAAEPELPL